ncbi:MAG: bifunctional phosphoribosylaminoimidazolecarboxamide formyltransferase/IMP cyclohydrolase [Candidatus Lokiarchaeota archaeon]|nr:bifunctional phosphoribosylaminoimidazolecarboxamide formyltransferase/IMP cyclohydrolase [Candidatus Lokiarchaeota archaeon]
MRIKTSLISVSNKEGINNFAAELSKLNIEVISTGGTRKKLVDGGLKVTPVSEITNFPEMMDGRVKTLHPKIHGGILAIRDNSNHLNEMKEHNIKPIDMVVVNLYPFESTISRPDSSLSEAIENIDIGGPTLIRSAAKNYKDVVVITNPESYDKIIEELKQNDGMISEVTRKKLALQAFNHTARYDSVISNYLNSKFKSAEKFPAIFSPSFEKLQNLRYGENPHQKAAFYKEINLKYPCIANARQLGGKELSYNNLYDINAALDMVRDFEDICCAVIKHTNPCGIAIGSDLLNTYIRAREVDPMSAFGSIVAFNRSLNPETAKEIIKTFVEVVIAPGFDNESVNILRNKKNLRIIDIESIHKRRNRIDWKKVDGGLLLQDKDEKIITSSDFKLVSKTKPSEKQKKALEFAWKVVKHVKSNAIVITKEKEAVGIGAGQMSRVDAVQLAIKKGADKVPGCVLASDAFFPFRDSIDAAAKAGITAIIEPGGSIRDKEVIEAADEHDLVLLFTGIRCFKH